MFLMSLICRSSEKSQRDRSGSVLELPSHFSEGDRQPSENHILFEASHQSINKGTLKEKLIGPSSLTGLNGLRCSKFFVSPEEGAPTKVFVPTTKTGSTILEK